MNKKIIILGKGGGSVEGAVRYDEPQQLTDEQKKQAQENIGIDLSANLKRKIVDALPSEGEQNIIYMVAKQASATGNVYDEYMYINGQWELIGSTEVDLSGYYTKEEADDKFLTEHQQIKTINGESIIGEGDLEIKGFSGDYNDLINKPTILNHWFGTKEEYEAIVEKDENTIYHIEGGDSMWFGTQAQYDALTEKEKDVLYFIEGNGGDYYTKEETDNAIQGAKETLQGEINAKVDNDTYEAKISEIEGVLSEKTTMAEVEAKGYLTEHQSLSNYYTKGETDTAIQGVKETLQGEIDGKVDTTTYEGKISEIEGVLEGNVKVITLESRSGEKEELNVIKDNPSDYLFNVYNSTVGRYILCSFQSYDEQIKRYNYKGSSVYSTTSAAISVCYISLNITINGISIPTYSANLNYESTVPVGSTDKTNWNKKTTMAEVEAKGYLTEHQPLKTINGEEIVGEGDIEIKGGEELEVFNLAVRSKEEVIALRNDIIAGKAISYDLRYNSQQLTLKVKGDSTSDTTFHRYLNRNNNISSFSVKNQEIRIAPDGRVYDFSPDLFNLYKNTITVKQGNETKGSFISLNPDTSANQTIQLSTVPSKLSELENDSGFLTEHQSLDNYYTKGEVDGKIPTETSELVFELADGTTKTINVVVKEG